MLDYGSGQSKLYFGQFYPLKSTYYSVNFTGTAKLSSKESSEAT